MLKIKRFLTLITIAFLTPSMFLQGQNLFCNGSFDSIRLSNSIAFVFMDNGPCWKTTASDGIMEIWTDGVYGVASYSGIQFCELNANYPSTLYQVISVQAGMQLSIGFAHMGRGGIDSISVSAGPVDGVFTELGRYGDGSYSWGYHKTYYRVPDSTKSIAIRFTSVYWDYGLSSVGNFLDEVNVNILNELTVEKCGAIKVYPNPAVDYAEIKSECTKACFSRIQLYSTEGKLQLDETLNCTNTYTIDRNGLTPGVYLFRLTSDSTTYYGKVVFIN